MPGFHVLTYGCQMNQHDSDRMSEVLRAAGHVEAASIDDADIIVLNTCSVREKSEQKLRSEVGRLAIRKRERPELLLAVSGCVAQQEGERLLRSMPDVDVIVGPDNIAELPALLADASAGAPPAVRTVFDVHQLGEPRFLEAAPEPGRAPKSTFVTIMKGCNERCSFCIVPTTRGPERYRPSSEILAEVRRLAHEGAREVTLLGQTVNSYADPSHALEAAALAGTAPRRSGAGLHGEAGDETEFPALLRAIARHVPELARLRYTSPHPRHLTPALVQAHADLPVLARHVHMPVQSGSDRVLRRMIRRYTVEEYVERLEELRRSVPGLTVSSDVIVGFPGETREDFEQTLSLITRVGFTQVYAFKYSERPSTPALKLKDDVPDEEKTARLAELFDLSEALTRSHLAGLVGSEAHVLIDKAARGGGFTGRSERNEIVHVGASGDAIGEVMPVRIVRAYKHSLEGDPLDASRARKREGAPPAGMDPALVAASRRMLPVVAGPGA
jgi:tRNA-2-methylthio-N6-dimethylallyladenosine synthase